MHRRSHSLWRTGLQRCACTILAGSHALFPFRCDGMKGLNRQAPSYFATMNSKPEAEQIPIIPHG